MTGIRVQPIRIVRQGRRQRAARISFRLSAPGEVVFVVRGPAPSCRVAARFRVRGRPGVNHIRFNGRVGRRNLRFGTYRITARTGRSRSSRPLLVAVGDHGVRSRFVCSASIPAAIFAELPGTLVGSRAARDGSGEAIASASTAGAGPKGARPAGSARSGVLSAVSEGLQEVPEPVSGLVLVVGLITLALLLVSSLMLVASAIRFFRRHQVG